MGDLIIQLVQVVGHFFHPLELPQKRNNFDLSQKLIVEKLRCCRTKKIVLPLRLPAKFGLKEYGRSKYCDSGQINKKWNLAALSLTTLI
jgi:hypothetical protein